MATRYCSIVWFPTSKGSIEIGCCFSKFTTENRHREQTVMAIAERNGAKDKGIQKDPAKQPEKNL